VSDSSTSDELDISHYLDVLLRRRWIVISAFTTRPVFQGSAMLVIEKERGGSAVSADGSITESKKHVSLV
jgi:uncharacterized protein involved in exopolysaccharide biosynthesis